MDKQYIYKSLTTYQKDDILAKSSRLGYLFIFGFDYQGLSFRNIDNSCPSDNIYRLYRLIITMRSLWNKCVRDAKDYDEFIKLYDDRFPCLIKEADSIAEKIRKSTKETSNEHPNS